MSKNKSITKNYGGVEDCFNAGVDRLTKKRKELVNFLESLTAQEKKAIFIAARIEKPTRNMPLEKATSIAVGILNKQGKFEAHWKNLAALLCAQPGDIQTTIALQSLMKKFVPDAKTSIDVDLSGEITQNQNVNADPDLVKKIAVEMAKREMDAIDRELGDDD